MLFTDEMKLSEHIAVKDDKGNRIFYRQIYEAALDMDEYKENRVLTLVYCDNSFENLSMVHQRFLR